jgi:hypothetical protein
MSEGGISVTDRPKVSIAMPVYNGGSYFELALQSALAQTYANIEIVIVNDGSTDNGATEAVALKYAAQDKRITYVAQANGGVAGALNTFMRHAKGDYFAWLSHDDLFLPHKIESQLAFLGKLGSKQASTFSAYALIDPKGDLICEVRDDIGKFIRRPSLSLLGGGINGCTLLIPMDVLREGGLFDTRLRHTQDYEFWGRIIKKHDFFFQPDLLVHYRVHPGQDSRKPAAIVEGDELWLNLVRDREGIEKVQLYGSVKNYYTQMAKFLALTPYAGALESVKKLAPAAANPDATLVSVILPFRDQIAQLVKAARSVLAQTHRNFELLLIDDGSTEALDALAELAQGDNRIRLVRQPRSGKAAARNLGLKLALGEYIAFLDAQDTFLPKKIETQMLAMQEEGAVFSHSSYFWHSPAAVLKSGILDVGQFSGEIYPRIIDDCPIAASTVMIHRLLLAEGYRFPEDLDGFDDVGLWASIAQRHHILAIETPHSDVERDQSQHAADAARSEALVKYFKQDPIHSRYSFEISSLENGTAINDCAYHKKLTHGDFESYIVTHYFYQGLEDYAAAFQIIEEAAHTPSGAECFDVMFRYGVSAAQIGRVSMAIETLEAADALSPGDPHNAYALGSLYATVGRLREAETLFARNTPVLCGSGDFAWTGILSFSPSAGSKRADHHSAARIANVIAAPAAPHGGWDAIYFAAADSTYFCRYAVQVANSIRKNSKCNVLIHFHVLNPDTEAERIIGLLKALGAPLAVTAETVDLSRLSTGARRAFYTCARYLVAPDIMRRYEAPLIIADIDQLIMSGLRPFLAANQGADVGLLRFEHNITNIFSLYSATLMILFPTPPAKDFATRLANNIRDVMASNSDLIWHLDQGMLAVTQMTSQDAKFSFFSPAFVDLAKPTPDAPRIFWSIGNAIEANTAKLSLPDFVKFAEALPAETQGPSV